MLRSPRSRRPPLFLPMAPSRPTSWTSDWVGKKRKNEKKKKRSGVCSRDHGMLKGGMEVKLIKPAALEGLSLPWISLTWSFAFSLPHPPDTAAYTCVSLQTRFSCCCRPPCAAVYRAFKISIHVRVWKPRESGGQAPSDALLPSPGTWRLPPAVNAFGDVERLYANSGVVGIPHRRHPL